MAEAVWLHESMLTRDVFSVDMQETPSCILGALTADRRRMSGVGHDWLKKANDVRV